MANVQNYIIVQRAENTVKKTEYDLNVWKRLLSYNAEIKVGLLVFGFTFLENPPVP